MLCAAALTATGHMTTVKWIRLRDLELPSLASRVNSKMWLYNVTETLALFYLASSVQNYGWSWTRRPHQQPGAGSAVGGGEVQIFLVLVNYD